VHNTSYTDIEICLNLESMVGKERIPSLSCSWTINSPCTYHKPDLTD
jgi:hypothetical protein